ncbi:DUF6056 family protein [Streptomyces exfoliatus]|uniref:DUF6056 family protein n=1 Tax=Streptomyces exfoliatus TaxID=1905 RepID=UPI0004CBFB6B|nr:DUF6056 family protein [Streptomyces exfoliatus]
MSRTTISERGDARRPEDGEDTDPDTDGDTGHGGRLRRALGGVALVVAAGTGALLAVGAFLGFYVRPTSDDWCALWKSRDMGVLGITADFYRTQNGRVTNAFLTGLLYSDDMRGPKLLPAFLVVALGLGLFLLAREVLRALRLPLPVVATVAAVLMLEALLFFAGTRAYQVLLWAPATISHTVPSVIGLWTVLGAVWAARRGVRWARSAAVVSVLLIGAAVGMLSEPFALVAGVFAVTVGILCLPRFGWARDRYVSTWCSAACLGLLCGLVLLYTSPGARWRRAQRPQEHLSAEGIGEALRDWCRLWLTVGGQWAYLGAVAVGALLGLALAATGPCLAGSARRRPTGLPPRALLRIAVLLPLPLIALASLAVVFGLRSGYGDGGWSYGRAWVSFLLPLLLALCAYGAWGGHLLGRRLLAPARPRPAGRVAVLVAVGAVAVGSTAALVRPVYDLTTSTVVRAVAWDRQDARIREEVAAGAREVAYQPLLIGLLTEPLFASSYERDWAARCTATYYGVDRIHRP